MVLRTGQPLLPAPPSLAELGAACRGACWPLHRGDQSTAAHMSSRAASRAAARHLLPCRQASICRGSTGLPTATMAAAVSHPAMAGGRRDQVVHVEAVFGSGKVGLEARTITASMATWTNSNHQAWDEFEVCWQASLPAGPTGQGKPNRPISGRLAAAAAGPRCGQAAAQASTLRHLPHDTHSSPSSRSGRRKPAQRAFANAARRRYCWVARRGRRAPIEVR